MPILYVALEKGDVPFSGAFCFAIENTTVSTRPPEQNEQAQCSRPTMILDI